MSVASKRELFVSSNESEFIAAALESGLRIDGRSLHSTRELTLSFNNFVTGQVQCDVGNTRVLAVVTAEITAPYGDRANDGVVSIFINQSPLASANNDAFNKSHDRSLEIDRLVNRSIRESRAIDTESLCIIAGKHVWNLRVDVHVLNHDGNVVDAITIAAMTALMQFKRNDLTVIGETITVHSLDDRPPVALSVHHTPVSCTYAMINSIIVADPSLKEECIADSVLTVTMNSNKEVCTLHKAGGSSMTQQQILDCLQQTTLKAAAVVDFMQQRVKEHDNRNRIKPTRAALAAIDALGKVITKQTVA